MGKADLYTELFEDLKAVLSAETDPIATMATINCMIMERLADVSWVGFYLPVSADELVVGPYQGGLGCLRIAFGRGVCGTAAATRQTQVVPDVHAFPGHIACDAMARSEIVVPVINSKGQLMAVFDIDSRSQSTFDELDQSHLERMLATFFGGMDWTYERG